MAREDMIMASQEESKRRQVIRKVLEGAGKLEVSGSVRSCRRSRVQILR